MKTIFVTGTAGFIGFHLAKLLLKEGFAVHGFDGMTDYYDVRLKRARHQILLQNKNFRCTEALLEDEEALNGAIDAAEPDIIIHLAAQAGVRYSLENPRSYINSNIIGTFVVTEAARRQKVEHFLCASTSSVYGASCDMPFAETDQADHQLTIYSATKKANESMCHSYAHLWDVPTTMLRFFTVYGPWGRPDMALFKFVRLISEGQPIDIYDHGNMYRDFTYVDDLVRCIRLVMDEAPVRPATPGIIKNRDSLSPVAPFRVVNIGNNDKIRLGDFIDAIEAEMGQKSIRNYIDMQPGDVPATWANTDLLQRLTGYTPRMSIQQGIAHFVKWYRDCYTTELGLHRP